MERANVIPCADEGASCGVAPGARFMRRLLTCGWMSLFVVVGVLSGIYADEPKPAAKQAEKASAGPDLTGYRTVETAVTATLAKETPTSPRQAPHLGVHVQPDEKGKLIIAELEDDSPAAKAGIKRGDILVKVDGRSVATGEALRELLLSRSAGDTL